MATVTFTSYTNDPSGTAQPAEYDFIPLLFERNPTPEDLFPHGGQELDTKALTRRPSQEARRPTHPPPFEGHRFSLGGSKP